MAPTPGLARRQLEPAQPRAARIANGGFVTRIFIVVIVSEQRDPPSSTYPAAPAVDTTGEAVSEPRPLAKCQTSNVVQLRRAS